MYNSIFILCFLLLSYSCWTAISVQKTPKENHSFKSHLSAISSTLSLEQDISTKADFPPFCLSTTLSACPPNSLCIEHRCTCRLGYLRHFNHHLEDGFKCILYRCKSSSDCVQRTFPNTVCKKSGGNGTSSRGRCVCLDDYQLDQLTQQCVYKGPVFTAKQRQFWSAVIAGAMLATALVFCCCLVHRATDVEGDNGGKSCLKKQAKENQVPLPAPPPPLPTLPHDSSLPGYFGDCRDFPPLYCP